MFACLGDVHFVDLFCDLGHFSCSDLRIVGVGGIFGEMRVIFELLFNCVIFFFFLFFGTCL